MAVETGAEQAAALEAKAKLDAAAGGSGEETASEVRGTNVAADAAPAPADASVADVDGATSSMKEDAAASPTADATTDTSATGADGAG